VSFAIRLTHYDAAMAYIITIISIKATDLEIRGVKN
jgi:hypothetical protein